MDAPLSAAALDQLCVNTLRFLSVDAVQQANSGHPGLPLGAAPMAYVLWTRLLKHNPANPHWFDRDRFVLSARHGSALLYSLPPATWCCANMASPATTCAPGPWPCCAHEGRSLAPGTKPCEK